MPPTSVVEPSVHWSPTAVPTFLDELLPALARLDQRLEQAIQSAPLLFGAEAATDLYRGLYVSATDVERLLTQPPGTPFFGSNGASASMGIGDAVPTGSRLHWLQSTYQLTAFDLDLLLLALAPELDRRYERLYAYLQDHVSRRWPTVDLALHLFCANALERIQRRGHFDPDAPLRRYGLLHLAPDPEQNASTLLAQTLRLDEQIVRFLIHQDALDGRLAPCCHVVPASAAHEPVVDPLLATALAQVVNQVVNQAKPKATPLCVVLLGRDAAAKRATVAAALANQAIPLLVLNCAQIHETKLTLGEVLPVAGRYATLYAMALYVDEWETLSGERERNEQQLRAALAHYTGQFFIASEQPGAPVTLMGANSITVDLAVPDVVKRQALWQQAVAHALGESLAPADIATLAGRFRLTATQIASAVHQAASQHRWEAASASVADATPGLPDFLKAARTQTGQQLGTLARKVDLLYRWPDLVLPEQALAQLHEICQRVLYHQQVFGQWGFACKLAQGKGVNVLFAGPSGAGKTMAAEVIANELALDLYKIDLSGVVSKYIGETEKNLNRVFAAALDANAILFFDEADALFGKRSEVSDAHDRYANIEISYLLQKMEEYDGVTILATNLRQNLDDAFLRRLAFAVHFPFPDEASRTQIWHRIWPETVPLAPDVDLTFMAQQFKLAGGHIKNIALAAAFLAAEEGTPVQMVHLLRATIREHQKLGKTLQHKELGSYAHQVVALYG